ncbi:stAR-related lipid transfer protein 9 isoform X3 [Mesocricetus auratus]|uniref:StAR-related lipid transfer protein 9 isoform X3 n=1 Tax=Mesocricetus auratus TaxID=10036 RepID=A0ABM2XH22_MESAU|nr:stAR-related lipid transfer protein 9 isoform X3 [Mesocricetus auratus]
MANVRVAVRVRPLSKREIKEGGRIIVEVDDKVTKIRNVKVSSRPESFGDSREKVVAFGFDYCYWSVNPEDPQYASQEVVFQDLGTEVLSGAAKGYNICLFAYGQTGSGKTYTMLGTPASVGLTPRICEGLFIREDDYASLPSSRSIKVSFLEIYNEQVRDLLKRSSQNKSYSLKIREHPEMGPYVQGLSQHVVTNYQQVIQLLEEGAANRITAATHVHEASSRSHAIFTVHYTQAVPQNNLPSETVSKINLVDLAGSERADPSYCKNRITEGANINKSLVTLGIVISTLAQNSQVFSSCQSLSSATSSGGDSGIPGTTSGTSSGGGPVRRQSYIPYRDSVLTWLLKESLGGNSKTIMVATVSPAHTSYRETMSTLRYASNAKSIINKPQVNEDANVKLIRELREEIERLKAMLLRFELGNFSSLHDELDKKKLILQNALQIDQLTQDWTRKWNDWWTLTEHYGVDINRRRAGVVIDSSLPHLMALEDDVLSTSVVIYHLKEGTTKIGRIDSDQEQDIVLQGQWIERDHCTITSTCGVVILRPTQGARCAVNGREVTASCRLTQGAVIILGKAQKFRFNHPAEAALLRHHRLQVGEALGSSGSLEWLNLDGDVTASRLGLCPVLWKERKVLQEESEKNQQTSRNGKISHRAQTEQQQCYVEDLRQQDIGQSRVQKEPEWDKTHNSQKIKDNQQWRLRGETWLATLQEIQQEDNSGEEKELEALVAPDVCLPTVPQILPSTLVQSQKRVVQLQCLGRRTSWATVWNIRQKKVSFQLERIIKKRRLLETQRRLEQLRAFYWLQDDGASKAPSCVCSSNTSGPGSQSRSKWTTCSSLSLQRLCSQRLSQPHSAFMNWNPSTISPPVPDLTHQIPEKTLSADSIPQVTAYPPRIGCLGRNSLHLSGWRKLYPTRGASTRRGVSCLTVSHESVNIQETETLGKHPCQMSSQGLVTKKLKPRDGSRTTATQARRAKGLVVSVNTQIGWQEEGSCETYKPPKETTSHSTYLSESEQAAGHGKVVKTFQAESKPSPPIRTSKKHQMVLPARGRDVAKKFSHLPHGSPLKRQPSTGNPDTLASFTDSRPMIDCVREKDNDLSDTDSSYSVDSLSYVYAKVPKELQKPEDLQEKWNLPDQESSESDNSQISEDSLAEKGYQSPPENSGGEYSSVDHGQSRARISFSIRHLPKPSDSSLCALAHRSFSLDSLIDAEELEEDRQEEPFLGSADEMPTETFWHLEKATLAAVDQEATCRPSPVNHRTGVRPNAFQPKRNSFYLDPHFQPHCEQPESEMAANYSEQANFLQGMQLARESPLVSVDSWFSCDSKVNLSSPSATVQSLCPSPDVHEIQPYNEMPRHWLNIEEVTPPSTVLPHSCKLLQGSAEQPPCSSDLYTTSTSDTFKPSVCGSQRLLQPVDCVFQGKEISDMIYQGISEESHNSDMSSVLAPSATSLTHVGTIREKDWAALQQKYLLELSNSVLDAVREPRPAFSFLEEDSSSLAEASEKVDTHLPVGSGISKNLDFSYFPVHLSKIRHLRAEKDHDSLSANLESASDLLSTVEKVSNNGAYSTDLESLTSGSINAQSCTTGNKIPNYVTEAWDVKQASLEGFLQGSKNPGLTTSSGQCFFQKKAYHNHDTLATKADQWPQDGALLRKNTAVPPRVLSHHSHPHPLLEEKPDSQQQAKETAGAHTDTSCTPPSGPELFLHSAPWSPFPSSLQPPPLETFYVTKSRDALTETALEIPACREAWVPSPPPREAWGFGHSYQVLQKTYWKNNLPKLSRSQNSKIDSYQQVTTKRPTNLNTEVVTEELEKCSSNISEEGNLDSAYCFVSHNRHHLPSTSLKVCECGNQLGILNKKYSLSVHKEGEGASAWHHCSVAFDGTESKTLLFICDSKAGGEEQSPLPPQVQACGVHSQSSGTRSDFIGKITSLDLKKVIPEETAVSLESRSLHCRVCSPVIMAGGGNPTHKWEERNETVLLREVISKDIQEESSLSGTQYTCERCHLVMCSQERKPLVCKAHGQSQEIKSKEEPLGEKQSKRVNNADEMARLMRSVMQLETGILEIESKHNKQLHASQTPSTEFMLQALQDQERADHVLIPESSGKHLFFNNQPSFPIQIEDGIFGDREGKEMEGNNAASNNAQAQKIVGSPFRLGGYAQKKQSESEHSHPPPGVEGLAKNTCDSLGKSITLREPSNISLHSRRMEVLARTLPLQPSVESSPEQDDDHLKASADFQDQAWTLGNLEEPETMDSFQESQIVELPSDSRLQDTKAHGRVEELAMEERGNLQEENMISLTQKLSAPSHQCKGTFSSQETVSPYHNQTGFSAALPYAERSATQPLHSPSLPRGCLYASDTKGMSLFEYMLEPTMLKINRSSLATGVGHQDYSGGARSSIPQGSVTGDASTAHTAWCGSVTPMVMRANGQSVTPESIEAEDWIAVSTSPQEHQRGDFRVTSIGLATQEVLGSEYEATVQKEIKTSSLHGVSRQTEKRVSFLLQEDSDHGEEERQKAETSEDQQPASSAGLISSSLLRAPDPEPLPLPDSSIHASICLAILAEIRQAKAQRKQLNDFAAEGTVLSCETSQEECFSEASRRPGKKIVKLGWDNTRTEGEAQGLHVASPSAVSADLLAAERKAQATPPSAGGFQHLPNPETDRGPGHHLLDSPHVVTDLKKRHCTGEPRGVSGWSDSSEVIKKKKGTSRTLSSVDPLAPDRLLSTPAVEQDRKVGSEKVSVLPSQTSCDDPDRIMHGQSQLGEWKTAAGISFDSQDCIPEYQEPRSPDGTCGGGSGKILVTTQERKAVHSECQSAICSVGNSIGLSGSKQDHIQCLDASTGFEEMKASPKSYAVHPGAPRKVEAEAHRWHPIKQKHVDSGLAEVCGADSKTPRSLLDQRPILHLCRVKEDTPGLCPEECLVFEGSTGGSRPPGLSYEEEENRTVPCPQLTASQPTAVHACCSHPSTLPCYKDGFLRKETPRAAPHPAYSHFIVPSKACEMDGTIESFPKDSQVFLEHDLKHKCVNVEFGPVDSSIPNLSTAAAVSSPAQSCYPPSTSEVKANCLTHAVAGGKSVESSEKRTSGKKASIQDAYPPSPVCSHSEPLKTLKDNSVGENIQALQAKSEPPVVIQGPHTLNLNEGSVDGEVVIAAQYGHLGSITRCCSEKTQPSTEVRGHSCMGSQANFIDMLKHTCHTQIETSWEEEEQQRDQASGDGKDHAQVRNLASSNEGGFDGSHTRDSEKVEIVVTKSPVSQTLFSDLEDIVSLPLGQTETSQPVAQTPDQLYSGREQLALRHRHSLPVIAVFSGPKHARYSPRPHFSVVSSSRSLHELNLSVESPFPADEDAQAPKRLWSPHLRGHCSEKPMSTSPKTQNCNPRAPCNVNNGPTDHRPLKPVIPPYPTSSTVSCMPTPDFMTKGIPGTLEQAHQGKTDKLNVQGMPENWHTQVDKEVLPFGSSDTNPYVLPWCPQEPVHIGWKQYVFGSVVDVSCSQKPQSLIPSDMAQCSSTNSALDGKKSPFHSHLSTYTQSQDLSNMCNSIENDQSSNEGWKIQSSSLAVEKPHMLIGSEGVAPTLDPDKRPPFRGSSEEIGCLRSELSLAGGSATAPVDEIVLLCPSETACALRKTRMNCFEQGTQTLGSRLHWSCTDISAQPGARTMSDSELASWTSMHNLSLHLSQLLHSTSELLGSLSQPSVVPKEQSIKSNSPDEAPQAFMMDGSTQTTVDEGIQTDLALPPLSFQSPEVKPQEVNVILEVMDSGITMFQEKEDVPGMFHKRGAEEAAEPQDLHEGSTRYKLQSPPMSSPCLRSQNLTFVSPPASTDGSPPPSLQPEESSMVVNSPSIPHHSGLFLGAPELTQEPDTQKPGPLSAQLVDRASSPILTFSASTQELSNTLACLTLLVPSAHSLTDVQEIAISPDLAVGSPRSLMDNSQATNELSVSQRAGSLEREDKSSLGKSSEGLVLDFSSPCSPQQSSSLQVSFLGQAPQQLHPMITTGDQSTLPSPPPRHRSLKLDDSFVPEKVASIDHGPQSSRRPSQWQGRAANEDESSGFMVEPQPSLDLSWRGLPPLSPCPISDTTGLQSPAVEPVQACQSVGLLCPGSHVCVAPGLQHHSLRDLPVHNKFDNWYGVQDGSCGGLHFSENLGVGCDSISGDQTQRPLQPFDNYNQDPEWPRLEHVPLQVGVQKPSLSVELTEAKLHRGFGETDALLKVLQNGTGEVFAPQEPAMSSSGELYTRQKKTIETLRRERAERLHNFRRTRSLSPQKQFSFLPSKDRPTWELDLPSRRREYLQQLRKDVVETTRIPEPALRSAHPPSDIELMLRDYHQAREEAKVEIAQARDRLRQRTEQEKLRIRQQIISQLLKEEEKLQSLANSSSLCTSSNGSLTSGITSLELKEDSRVPDFRDTWIGDWRGRSTVRNSQLYLTRSSWKSLAHSCRASLGSGCCSPFSLSSLGTCFSPYQDLAKHIVNTSMADVMAACSDNLHNLFSRQATAGWNYQGEEQEVQLYYKEFSSTRHGFLGAGVVLQPLSHVWAAVSDPTLWPLYHKPIQTARLHQRVSNSISLVYLVCDTTLCSLKQLRDFCCVCVEAKEGHLSIMAAQSVYDTSMPRPSRKMVRGEILPSAWVLQPVITEGKEITRVIFLAQVELGAPGFPPHLLNSFIKQQPLVVAKLASFLGS